MIEFDMVGMSSGFFCINPFNLGWLKKFVVLDVDEALIISFVVKGLKWCVFKVDDN